MEKPWKKCAKGITFLYNTEFRKSQIPDSGNGWWALEDIPANVCLRKVSIADKTLLRFINLDELKQTNWNLDEYVHYGICHRLEKNAIFFLNPSTAMNHSSNPSVYYKMDKIGEIEIWTSKNIKNGEEIFSNYSSDFNMNCDWYDEHCLSFDKVPISQVVNKYNLN